MCPCMRRWVGVGWGGVGGWRQTTCPCMRRRSVEVALHCAGCIFFSVREGSELRVQHRVMQAGMQGSLGLLID